jgi:hypothetical protein
VIQVAPSRRHVRPDLGGPDPREQEVDAVYGVVGDAGQHPAAVGERVDAATTEASPKRAAGRGRSGPGIRSSSRGFRVATTFQTAPAIVHQRLMPLLPARSASCRWRAEDGLQWPVCHQMWAVPEPEG